MSHLLTQTKFQDKNIDQLHLEARSLQEILCDEKVKLAVNQYRLEEKTVEYNSLKDKYKVLLNQHSSC